MIAEHIDPEDSTFDRTELFYMMQGRKIFPAHWDWLPNLMTSLGNVFAEILRARIPLKHYTESRFIHALVNKLFILSVDGNLKAEIYGGTSYKPGSFTPVWPDIEKLRALDGTDCIRLGREIDNRTLVMEFDIMRQAVNTPFRTLEGYYHYLRILDYLMRGRMASNFYARPGEYFVTPHGTPSTDGLNHFNIYSQGRTEIKEAFVRYLLRMGYQSTLVDMLPASAETTYPVLRPILPPEEERLRVDGASVDALAAAFGFTFAL
ncbi:hypothetical protein SPFM1_00056 [Salmonella phage SPFM1]|nr:hypothetical protein SPFM1_00056 [Salmonella phage SPFM1]